MSNTSTESISGNILNDSFDSNPVDSPNTCPNGSIAKSVLTRLQKTIQEVGLYKSFFATKIKATMNPIGTFLWKYFLCRLSNALEKAGLFSSVKTKPLEPLPIHETSQEAVPCEEVQVLSTTNIANLANTATISKEPLFAFAQVLEKSFVHFKKPEVLKTIVYETIPYAKPIASNRVSLSFFPMQPKLTELPKPQKALVIHEASQEALSTLSARLKMPPVAKMSLKEKPNANLPTVNEEDLVGILLLDSPNNIEKQEITPEKFFHFASEVFGEDLIKRVQSWEKFTLPKNLQKGDFLHALAAIGHAATLNDLAYLLKRVREGKVDLELSSTEQDVSKLLAEDIKKLVVFFRNPLPHLTKEATVLWEELKPDQHPIDSKRVAYTKHEYYINQLEKEAKTLTSEEKKLLPFASSEQLAKFVGYAKPDTLCEGMIIPVFTGYNIEYYTLKNHINTKGLHCCLFTPLNKGLPLPAQMIFRGTDGIGSLKRDLLDPNGIGKTVFDDCAPQIAKIVNSYCESTSNPVLEIAGHSLGGSDSQRATALCVELFNNPSSLVEVCNESFEAISRLSRISCSAFCSPKLDAPTIELWETEIEKLSNSQLKLDLNFAHHANDLVTWAGYQNLYMPGVKNKNFQITHLLVNSASNCLSTNTHHREAFFKGAKFNTSIDNRHYTFYNNQELEELKARHKQLIDDSDNNNITEDSLLTSFVVMENNPRFMEQNLTESMVMLESIQLPKEKIEEEAVYNELCSLLSKKKKIDFAQYGFSSKDSWIVFMLEKVLIQPSKRTFAYFSA